MAIATHNLSVKVGTYIKDGEEKPRWVNIGRVLESEQNGKKSMFLLLNKTFNPAGVPDPDQRDSIIVSMFPIVEDQPQQAAPAPRQDEHNRAKSNGYAPQAPAFDDDIP